MNGWLLEKIASGSPFGVAFEEDPPASGDPAPTDPPASDPPPTDPPAGDPATWSHAEGVAGEGDAPEWFKGDKYATVADQAKAYKDLEGKFGAFTGAPDEYEVKVSAELAEKGVEIAADDPMVEAAMEFAKTAGMDQAGFEGMLNLYSMQKLAEQGAYDQYKADELKALGQNAQGRIDGLNQWASANLSEDQMAGFTEMAQSAASVAVLEHLVGMTRAAPLDPNGDASPGGITETELNEMQFAKDDHGNRRINTDKAFKAEYEKKRDLFYGTGDHRVVVG